MELITCSKYDLLKLSHILRQLIPYIFTAIKINLNNPDLRSGTKYYERVKKALSHELLSKKSLQISWTPPDSSICKSSIAKYFVDRQYDVQLIETQVKIHQEYSLKMPLLGENNFIKDVDELFATPHELVEYIGMLSLSCSLEQDDYLNSYNCIGKSMNVGSAKVIQWNGMFDCISIIHLLDELKYVLVALDQTFIKSSCIFYRKYVSDQSIPWVSLYCHGFPHAALSFGVREHSFGSNGDNSYIVLVAPDKKCLWYEFLSSNKAAK